MTLLFLSFILLSEKCFFFWKRFLQEGIDGSTIMYLLDFSFMQGFYICRFVFEPSQIDGNKMDLITSNTSYQNNSFMVGIFREGLDLFCIALTASEHEDIELAGLRIFRTWDFVEDG